jgi:hypothetical protein
MSLPPPPTTSFLPPSGQANAFRSGKSNVKRAIPSFFETLQPTTDAEAEIHGNAQTQQKDIVDPFASQGGHGNLFSDDTVDLGNTTRDKQANIDPFAAAEPFQDIPSFGKVDSFAEVGGFDEFGLHSVVEERAQNHFGEASFDRSINAQPMPTWKWDDTFQMYHDAELDLFFSLGDDAVHWFGYRMDAETGEWQYADYAIPVNSSSQDHSIIEHVEPHSDSLLDHITEPEKIESTPEQTAEVPERMPHQIAEVPEEIPEQIAVVREQIPEKEAVDQKETIPGLGTGSPSFATSLFGGPITPEKPALQIDTATARPKAREKTREPSVHESPINFGTPANSAFAFTPQTGNVSAKVSPSINKHAGESFAPSKPDTPTRDPFAPSDSPIHFFSNDSFSKPLEPVKPLFESFNQSLVFDEPAPELVDSPQHRFAEEPFEIVPGTMEEHVSEQIEEPAVQEPIVEKTVKEPPAVQEAIVQETVEEPPAVQEAIVQETVEEPLAMQEAIVQETVEEPPVVQEAIVEETVAEPAVQELQVEEHIEIQELPKEPSPSESPIKNPVSPIRPSRIPEAIKASPLLPRKPLPEPIPEAKEPIRLQEVEIKPEKVKKHLDLAKDMFAFLDSIGTAPKKVEPTAEPIRERRKKVDSSVFDDLLAGVLGQDTARELTSGERRRNRSKAASRTAASVDNSPLEVVPAPGESVSIVESLPVVSMEPITAPISMVESIPIADPIVENIPIAEPIFESIPIAEPIVESIPIVEPIVESIPIAEPIVESIPIAESIVEDIPPTEIVSVVESVQATETIPTAEPILEEQSIPSLTEYTVEEPDETKRYPYKGHPLAVFGAGGKFISMLPRRRSRFSAAHGKMLHHVSPGVVKVENATGLNWSKDFERVLDAIEKWNGPVCELEKEDLLKRVGGFVHALEERLMLVDEAAHASVGDDISEDDKRKIIALDEEILYWKLISLDVTSDGKLVSGHVGDVLDLVRELLVLKGKREGIFESIEDSLIRGDRIHAATVAKDGDLWAHALVLATDTTPEFYKSILQAFSERDVTVSTQLKPGPGLKVLYHLLSGVVDVSFFKEGELEKLAKWRDVLCILLANRVEGWSDAVVELGSVLMTHGRPFAANIWFVLDF